MKEVWDMKDKAYEDFVASGYSTYADYLKNELKNVKITFESKVSVTK